MLATLGCVLAAEEPAPRTAPPMRVMTFNIMWEEKGVRAGNLALPVWKDRKDLVNRLVLRGEADLVGFQEASPEQQAGLRVGLAGYELVFHREVNNTNPILFRSARFRLLESGAFVLNREPEVAGTNIGVRSSTWAHLEDKESGRELWIYSLHLDHRSKGPTRQISAVRLMERVAKHRGVVIVTGDFNTAEKSPEMQFFQGRGQLTNDAGERVGNEVPLVNAYRAVHPEAPGRIIDHVLTGPGITIRKAGRTASGRASDHDLFWAEVTLP